MKAALGAFSVEKIYPNPVKDKLHIKVKSNFNSYDVKIISMQGKTVFYKNNLSSQEEISLSGLPSGMYICKIIKDEECIHFKLLKQ